MKSQHIISYFEANPIETFRLWNFYYRGGGGIWVKKINDSICYQIFYCSDQNTEKLIVGNEFSIFLDFPIRIQIDTSKIHSLVILQSKKREIILSEEYIVKNQSIIVNKIVRGTLFNKNSPLNFFHRLNAITNNLDVTKIEYLPSRDRITFSIQPGYELIYYSDSTMLRMDFKKLLDNRLYRTFWLTRNWFLQCQKTKPGPNECAN